MGGLSKWQLGVGSVKPGGSLIVILSLVTALGVETRRPGRLSGLVRCVTPLECSYGENYSVEKLFKASSCWLSTGCVRPDKHFQNKMLP